MFARITSLIMIIKYKLKYRSRFVCSYSATLPTTFKLRISGGVFVCGRHVEIREYVVVNISNGGSVVLEDEVFLNDFCCINAQKQILIKRGCQLGQAVKIYDHDHEYLNDDFKYHFKRAEVLLDEGVWCGSDVIILRGSQIGKRSVLGAGFVVKGQIPPRTVCYLKNEIIEKPFDNQGA